MADRPRRVRIGPFFAVSLVVAGVWLYQQRGAVGLTRPAIREARPADLPRSDLGITPEPAWLLRHAGPLGLTAAQRRQLNKLAADLQRATRADRGRLDGTTGEIGDYLEHRRSRGGLDPDAARDRAADLGELSARLAAARHAAWDRAWKLLTPEQQDQVRRLRQQTPLEMR
ncbi:MAG: hypothetical protein HYU66_20115 [Armatimonadetes bacterium]|nr:hypothetical protein [Armatimonadota bacterium]